MKVKVFLKALKGRGKEAQLKIYDTVLGDKIAELPFEQQVKLARKLSIGPMPAVRANLLKQMPNDLARYVKQGMTATEVKEMYWSCKEFTDWWKLLQLEEAMLDEFIRQAFNGTN